MSTVGLGDGIFFARRLPFVLIAFFVVLEQPSIILVNIVDLVKLS